MTGAAGNGRGGLVVALVATGLAAVLPGLVANRFGETFEAFGTALPGPAAFFVYHHEWLWVLPLLAQCRALIVIVLPAGIGAPSRHMG